MWLLLNGTCQGGSFHLPMCCIALIVIFPHCYPKYLKMCSIWQCIDICSNISNVLPSPISQMQRHSDQSCSSTDFTTDDKTWPTQMYSNMPTWKLGCNHIQNAQVCLNMVKFISKIYAWHTTSFAPHIYICVSSHWSGSKSGCAKPTYSALHGMMSSSWAINCHPPPSTHPI